MLPAQRRGYDLKPRCLAHLPDPGHRRAGRLGDPGVAAETIAALLPNSKLVVFEKSGHSPQIEEAELFQQTMRDFLAEALPDLGAVAMITRRTLSVPDLGPDGLDIPYFDMRVAADGPQLTVLAGIHGAEYTSIAAVREFVRNLDPAASPGRIIAVPVVERSGVLGPNAVHRPRRRQEPEPQLPR